MDVEDKIVIQYKSTGNPSVIFSLLESAWDECEELQVNPKEEYIFSQRLYWRQLDAWEVIYTRGEEMLGALGVTQDYDIHCGDIASIVSFYVLPEHRKGGIGGKLFREAIRIAKENNFKILGFTHRVKPWVYQTRYIKL